jgi:CRP-like cAMP-binding protein
MGATLRFEPASPLFCEGQFCDHALELLSGTVAVSTEPGNRRRAPYVRWRTAGELIGVAETFSQTPYQSTAIAVTKVEARPISRNELLQMLGNPETAFPLLSGVTKELTRLFETVRRIPHRQWHRNQQPSAGVPLGKAA